jgi:23S rRNA pseudouridine1911/1915/1917 synthase
MAEREIRTAIIPETLAGARLDRALVELFPEYSRARLAQWIRLGHASVDGATRRPKDRVWGGEQVRLAAEPLGATEGWQPEELTLDVVYEDEHLLVVNKPPDLVVHPGAGNRRGTLVNALLFRDPDLADIPRAGVVHRLDKNTSGLLVVARTLLAHKRLVAALKERTVKREYLAIVVGRVTGSGRVEAPVGRDRLRRTRMAVSTSGKPAATRYRVAQRFRAHTCLRLELESGRTHQIRVHMAHLGHPLLGDPTYGGRLRIPADSSAALAEALGGFKRQALHAAALSLAHPASGEPVAWSSPVPGDMAAVLTALEEDQRRHSRRAT